MRIIACIEDAGSKRSFTHLDAKAPKRVALMRPPCWAPPKRGYWTDRIFPIDDLKAAIPAGAVMVTAGMPCRHAPKNRLTTILTGGRANRGSSW